MYQDLVKQNITVHNALDALNFADTTIATNYNELVLLIKTPVLDGRIFNKVYVFPVVNNHKEIHLTSRNYLTHETGNYIVKSLTSTIYKTHEATFDNSECLPNLLSGQHARCIYSMIPPDEEITVINDENIIINSDKKIFLASNCGLSNRTLTGTFLITFHSCEVNINNTIYSNKIQSLVESPIRLPLEGIIIQKQFTIANLSLEHLHNLHLEARKEMDYIRLNNTSIQWPTWSILGGLISLPYMIIGVMILLKIIFHRSATIKIQHSPNTSHIQDPWNEIQPNLRPLTIRDVIRTEPHLSGGTS